LLHLTLVRRLLALAILFTLELVSITVWFDGTALLNQGGLVGLLGFSGAWLLKGIVAFAALFVTFAVLETQGRSRNTLQLVSEGLAGSRPVSPVWLATHLVLLGLFWTLARVLFAAAAPARFAAPIALLWLVIGITAIAAGACAIIPPGSWRQLLYGTGTLWVYALGTSIVACLLGEYARTLWTSAGSWTFYMVKAILTLFLPGVFADLSTMSIGTRNFNVQIAPQCSGLEGAALILGFCALWLWLLRREFRFPHALILAPLSVATLFLLNSVRIAVLILIGNAGAPDIALGGFHSQAGWIAFNAVAIVLMPVTRRVQWITASHAGALTAPALAGNSAAPYLLPFLCTLAAAMLSRAASAGFEWLYPLRLVAAGAALWMFRTYYKKLDWRFGWEAPAVGALVCALWLAGDWLSGVHPPNPLTPSPTPWVATAQSIWLVLRLLSAIVTVPIAEELAFRSYLIRRMISADFEQLSPRAFTAMSLILSSLAFGILHGERWIAGTIAGLLYAAVLIHRGRIGDAVVAHATTNGLLAASVLVTGQWNLS
jgi:exosortase E/protease (VPEID-CTERM system)